MRSWAHIRGRITTSDSHLDAVAFVLRTTAGSSAGLQASVSHIWEGNEDTSGHDSDQGVGRSQQSHGRCGRLCTMIAPALGK